VERVIIRLHCLHPNASGAALTYNFVHLPEILIIYNTNV
jgi:hypothetical protein